MSIIDYSWDFSKEEFSLDLDFFNEKEQEDKLWQARTGLNFETLCGAIETIIFMNDRPVSLQKIKNQIDNEIPLRVVHESITRLQTEYESKHHGIRLMEVAQGYQFRTKATYAKIVQKMFKVQSFQLSPTALEVLAMIAYKQPISKTTVESIRGVDSSHVVRALMDRRLVKIVGRSEEMGRPSLYGTTTEFLEVFNLNTIDDLPSEVELEELSNANEIGQISDIRNIISSREKKIFDNDELIELDELSSNINEIASDTLFTRSLKEMDKVRKSDEGVEKKSAFDILEEYVSKAQIVEQNKAAGESEVLTSMMEPKVVELSKLMNHIFNAPEMEDDLEIDVELEDDRYYGLKDQLDRSLEFEELDSSSVKEIELQADMVLEKSEEILKACSIEDEIDMAFDQLLSEDSESNENNDYLLEDISIGDSRVDDLDDLDISSFISAKLIHASSETNNSASEEAELAAALDQAFAKLKLSDDDEQRAEDLDIDINFLKSSLSDENHGPELDS